MMKKNRASRNADPKNQINDTTKTRVLSILTDCPQSRFDIARTLKISERSVRNAICQLRKEGYKICASAHAGGYWIGSPEECRQTARELRSRAYDLLKTAKALEGVDPNQITLDEVMHL